MDVILDPCTTIVAFRSTFPVPSITIAARMRVVGSCAETAAAEKTTTNSRAWNRMAHYNPLTRPMLKPITAFVFAAALMALASESPEVDWPVYGGDQGGTKYSRLTDVNPSNVSRLKAAWEWKTGEKALPAHGTRPGNFQTTPLMIDNVLYFSTPYNRVVALNADTGAELWSFDPKAYEDGQPPNGTGFVHRGVAAWRDGAAGNKLRIFINSRYRLICLDAATGHGRSTGRTTRTRRRPLCTRT
ncbi:MAG: hypothetical protein DMF97_16310 [Acidobacteria bacterium]|nr:MAG: hypothetical protein DMF97_16310 [Acidobacteriota bacterium]